jgi:hypothetical protein
VDVKPLFKQYEIGKNLVDIFKVAGIKIIPKRLTYLSAQKWK